MEYWIFHSFNKVLNFLRFKGNEVLLIAMEFRFIYFILIKPVIS